MDNRFSLSARARSFGFAFAGLKPLLIDQHNARIHLLCSLLVMLVGLWLQVSAEQWCVLILAMGLVWAAEAMNSGVEYVADAAVPDENPLIGKAKDVAAAGVLLASVAAAVVAAIIFLPLMSAKYLA